MKIFKDQYPAIIYSALYLVCLPFYLYNVNSDTVSYIAIAENYADGNWETAINGFWSPLFSFLLLPFICLHVDPLLGIKIISLASSFLIFYSFKKLSVQVGLKTQEIRKANYFLIPILLWKSLSIATPDLMATALLWFFLAKLFKTPYNARDYILIPLLGFLCYLGKYYNFYFIILALFTRTFFFKDAFRIKELVVTVSLFIFVCSLWLACLYNKYDQLTPTTATAYNLYIYGPESYLKIKETEQKTGVLLGIRRSPGERGEITDYLDYSKYRYSSWEDPTFYRGRWNPLQNLWSIKFYVSELILKNFILLAYSLIIYLATIIYLVLFHRRKLKNILNEKILFIFILAVLYPAGYVLTHFENRYILFSEFLLIFLLFFISTKLETVGRRIINSVLIILSAAYSYQSIIHFSDKGVEASKIAANKINNYANGNVLYSTPLCWSNALFISYFSKKIKFHDAVIHAYKDDVPEDSFLLACKPLEISQVQKDFPMAEIIYATNDIAVLKIVRSVIQNDYIYIYKQ